MNNLDTAQLEQLKAIGTYLGQIRQQQARSLEDIAAKTYIPLRLLRAIEAGQEKILPEPVFVQGFIRRYADALGLDGIDLSQQFPIHAAPIYHEPKPENFLDTSPRTLLQPAVLENSKLSSRLSSRPPQRNYAPLYAILAVLAVAGLMYGLFRSRPPAQSDAAAQQSQTAPDDSKSVSAAPKVQSLPSALSSAREPSSNGSSSTAGIPSLTSSQAASSPFAQATSTPSPAASISGTVSPITVNVSLLDRSWLQVAIDGNVEFEGVLPKGTQRSWAGKKTITVVSGNAGGVSVALNQGKAEVMGKAGQVEEKTYTAKAASSQSSN